MRSQGRKRAGIVVAAVTLLNVAVYGAYTLPRTLQQRSMTSRVETLRKELDLERRRVDALRNRAEVIRANERDLSRFYGSTVKLRSASLVPILRAVESLAAGQGVRVGAQSFRWDGVKGAGLERLLMTMPVSGSYRQLVGFIESLESSPDFLTLDQVQVRGTEGGQEAHLEMVVSCYFRTTTGGQSR